MAITGATVTLTKKEYTWRIQIFAEAGQEPVIEFLRETRLVDAQGNVVGPPDRNVPSVTRRLSQVAARSFATMDGSKSLTGAELMGLFAKGGDDLRQEDLST
jgi:hypothetical protein